MPNIRIIGPLLVLSLQFLLKLAVARKIKGESLLLALIELPVSLIFLPVSLSLIFTGTQTDKDHRGLIFLMVFILFAVFITAMFRVCLEIYDSKQRIWLLFFLLPINIGLPIWSLFFSMNWFIK
jgi:hypothetical protein